MTLDTSGCLGAAMATCDKEVKQHVLAYYALFTNESCLADPNAAYTTPAYVTCTLFLFFVFLFFVVDVLHWITPALF